jgi:hypothetical protein
MVNANLKIINELKIFLDDISKDESLRRLVSSSEQDFSRNRKLPLERLAGLIINLPKRSLSIEIREFFNAFSKGLEGCTKGAFSLQRSKLSPLFFKAWCKCLVDNFYHHYGDKAKRWRGFILQAVDGSTAYLLNKMEVKKYFGAQANQHVSIPMARVVQVHDVLNDITVWGDIYPIIKSEQSIIASKVQQLAPDSLTLFDRGYPGYALMYMMINEETPRHFVMRCKSTMNMEVKQFLRSKNKSKIVDLAPGKVAIETLLGNGFIVTPSTHIKVRMQKVRLPDGQTEVLLTNLYDEKMYSAADLKYLYGLRWGIETSYGKQKNQQQMEQFSGHRVICIQQDYAAGLFVANLQSLIEKQSGRYLHKVNKQRKHIYRINRNISWASLKHQIVRLFLHNNPRKILILLQKSFERNLEPVRPGRKYPRIFKVNRLHGKYQTFTNYKRAI